MKVHFSPCRRGAGSLWLPAPFDALHSTLEGHPRRRLPVLRRSPPASRRAQRHVEHRPRSARVCPDIASLMSRRLMQRTKEAASKTASFRDHSVCSAPSRSKKCHLPQPRDLCTAETKRPLMQVKAGRHQAAPVDPRRWSPGRSYPTRTRCSILAAGPPARALRVPDGNVCEPARLFHGPIVSTMILIPANALSIWRCTLSTSVLRNSCIFWSSETNP